MHAKTLKTLIAGAFLLAGAAATRAATIAYDGFESYTAGTAMPDRGTAGELNGGTGWSNAWDGDAVSSGDASIVSKSMSYSGGDISVNGGSNALRIRNTNSHVALRSYAAQTDSVYLGYLFETNANNEFFQQWNAKDEAFAGSDTDQASVMQRLDGSSNPRFGVRINDNSTQQYGTTPNVVNNTTYYLVARVSKTGGSTFYNTMDLMVNPTSSAEPSTWDASWTNNTDTGLDQLASLGFRLANVETGDEYFIDEIRVGDSWSAVAVPEPSTLLLVGGALGALLLFRRRRR